MSSRREFIQLVPIAACGLALSKGAFAQAKMVDEKSPQAVGLGYVADATRADKAKYAKYAAGQACANCQLFQGKAGDAAGGCGIFPGLQVSAKGWCSAYVKKA